MVSKIMEEQLPPDPREAELVEDMILDAMEYIHGKGAESINGLLSKSTDTAKTMSTIAYKIVRSVAEKHKATAQIEMDMDMMMGVTTETIDMITEVAEAGSQFMPGTNVEQLKEDTLLRVSVLHGQQLEGTEGFAEDMQVQAATDLRDYMSDGGTQKAFDYVNDRAKTEGLNPNDMMRAGNEAVFGTRTPLEDAMKQGLMGQSKWDALGQVAPVAGAALAAYGEEDEDQKTDLYASTPDEGPRAGVNMLEAPAPAPAPIPLMGGPGTRTPEQQPTMPRGEGLLPSGTGLPPLEQPTPPPNRQPRGRR